MDKGNERERSTSPTDQSQSRATLPSHVTGVPLLRDEEVLIDGRPALSAWGSHLVLTPFVALGGSLAFGPLVGLLLGVVVVAYVLSRWWTIQYLVTDHRIVVHGGIVGSSTSEIWLEDVRGLQTGASPLERLLGHGHVSVSNAVSASGDRRLEGVTLRGIPNSERIAAVIRDRRSTRQSEAD